MEPQFVWPDLLLQISATSHPDGRLQLCFQGVVSGTEPRDFGNIQVVNPQIKNNQLGHILDRWADPEETEDSVALALHLEGIGYTLYRDLIPSKLKDFYWSELHTSEGLTVLLLPEGAANNLPWEIVRPARDEEQAPFWCEHFCLARWLSSYPIEISLPDHPVSCVLADPGLDYVALPAYERLGISREEIIDTWDKLLELLKSEGVGILHWTGHGEPCLNNPSLSRLPIAGQTFRPVDILPPRRRRFLRKRPWVFLHACSTNRATESFLGLGGWPADLIDAGVGAVLGTAWDVRTCTAKLFAGHLYDQLLQGETVGNAVRRARVLAQRSDDPSWLAYQLYAHPAARLNRTQAQVKAASEPIRVIIQRVFGTLDQEDLSWRHVYLSRMRDAGLHADLAKVPLAGTGSRDHSLEYSTIYIESADKVDHVVANTFTDVVEAVQQYRSVVLLGESGAGKTATLHRIARVLADKALSVEQGVPTPVLVSLNEFEIGDLPLGYLRARCGDETLRSRMEAELLGKRLCVLCDGLNEVSRKDYMKKVRAWRSLIERYPGNLYVFACRTPWYHDELHLRKIEISPLDDERIVRALFIGVGEEADGLWESLKSTGLQEIIRRPLFLDWVVQSYLASGRHLPRNRSLLLKGLVDSLARREQESGAYETLALDSVTQALAEVAFRIQSGADRGVVGLRQAEDVFEQMAPKNVASRSFAEDAMAFSISVGLLVTKHDTVQFSNQQLRDYFCGLAIVTRFEKGESLSPFCKADLLSVAEPEAKDPRQPLSPPLSTDWEEPLVVASGFIANGSRMLMSVCEESPRLAGECLIRNAPSVDSRTIDSIRECILDVACEDTISLPERLYSAITLSRIGDPRFCVNHKTNSAPYVTPNVVHIDAGVVLLGSPASLSDAFADERPQFRVELPSYGIGRYPVTNAEFKFFSQSGGYNERKFWTQAGWRWRQTKDTGEGAIARQLRNLAYFRENVDDMVAWFEAAGIPSSQRALWRRLLRLDAPAAGKLLLEEGYGMVRMRDRPAFENEPRFNAENQPVVGVTWYEAMAYCSWLSEMSGEVFILPSEAQWERAAKGDDDRIYPWGSTWMPDRCNGLSERVLRPSPVGVFPAGKSPFGCEDMVGNVFEWTSSRFHRYPYDFRDECEDPNCDEVRVTRGGGWDSVKRVTRCALRGDMCEPSTYDCNLGFRIAKA